MAYGDNYTSGFLTDYFQKRGATGRFPTARETAPMFAPIMQNNLMRAQQLFEQSMRQKDMALREKAIADQTRAAKVSGVTQLLGLPIQGALGYGVAKQAGLLGAANGGAVVPSGVSPAGIPLANAGAGYVPGAASAPGAGMGLLGTLGAVGGLFGAQQVAGNALEGTMNKAGFKNANTGFKFGGVPGAMAGGTIDVVKKVGDFIGGLF